MSSSSSSSNSSRSRSSRPETKDDRATRARELQQQASDGKEKVVEAGKAVKDAVGNALESGADMLGGWSELDMTIKRYNRQFYDFARNSFFAKTDVLNGPTKLLLVCFGCTMLQSSLPIFAWPLDAVSQLLGFLFLYNTALTDLRRGFKHDSEAHRVKALLTAFLVVSTTQLVPGFLFDTSFHFGSLWSFFLPVLLFVNPDGKDKTKTIASLVNDTVFGQIEDVIRSIIPREFEGKDGNRWSIGAAAVMALLLWMGVLGASGSYIATWAFLSLQTVSSLGAPLPKASKYPKEYVESMKTQHCLLAIWMWRYLLSTIEGFTIPPFFSMIGFILHYLPSYYLWVTAYIVGMIVTPQIQKENKADTWYAKWLRGPQRRSGTRPEGSSSNSRESGGRPSSGR